MKGLCCVKLCNTELYPTVVILPFFRKKLSFVILKGRKGELNTKIAPIAVLQNPCYDGKVFTRRSTAYDGLTSR